MRLIAELFCVSNPAALGRPFCLAEIATPDRLRLSVAFAQQVLGEIGERGLGQCGERQRAGDVDGREPEPGGEQPIENAFAKTL